jgi:hypothetical protein
MFPFRAELEYVDAPPDEEGTPTFQPDDSAQTPPTASAEKAPGCENRKDNEINMTTTCVPRNGSSDRSE